MMNFLYNLYFKTPRPAFLGRINNGIDGISGMMLKRLFNKFTVNRFKREASHAPYGLNTSDRAEKYVVSVTSFPGRINDIWITIETILRQSFKPDAIILWLFEGQFPDHVVPPSLEALKQRGLTIKFVDQNLRSHTKYYYAFQQYPDATVITLDDDVYYPENTIKNLVELHEKYPGAIISNRAHKMAFNSEGNIKPYRQWEHNCKSIKTPSSLLVPTGFGGVLYPPDSFHEDLYDQKTFRDICYMADDLWLRIASLRKGTKVVTNPKFNRDFVTSGNTQDVKLVSDNSHGGGNDVQLKNVCDHYKINIRELCLEA